MASNSPSSSKAQPHLIETSNVHVLHLYIPYSWVSVCNPNTPTPHPKHKPQRRAYLQNIHHFFPSLAPLFATSSLPMILQK